MGGGGTAGGWKDVLESRPLPIQRLQSRSQVGAFAFPFGTLSCTFLQAATLVNNLKPPGRSGKMGL
jgi:hypothetical protein